MIYLDYAATTPLDPRVYEHMLPSLKDVWGNPSSPHAKGREARHALDTSRQLLAEPLGLKPEEVIFVGSGSEANNLAILGVCAAWLQAHQSPGHIITAPTEHHCVLQPIEHLASQGWRVTHVPVDRYGRLAIHDLEAAFEHDTALVSIQWANNETGTVQPVSDIAAACQERTVPFHCDALQPIGQLPLPDPLPDLFAIAAHKFYGPKGAGALLARNTVGLKPVVLGGNQEFSLRAGTENVPGAVGLSEAFKFAIDEQPQTHEHICALHQLCIDQLSDLPETAINSHPEHVLPSIISVHTPGHSGETLVMQLDLAGVCASTGSACTSGSAQPSHVLTALGHDAAAAQEHVRLSLGKTTTTEELTAALEIFTDLLRSPQSQ